MCDSNSKYTLCFVVNHTTNLCLIKGVQSIQRKAQQFEITLLRRYEIKLNSKISNSYKYLQDKFPLDFTSFHELKLI